MAIFEDTLEGLQILVYKFSGFNLYINQERTAVFKKPLNSGSTGGFWRYHGLEKPHLSPERHVKAWSNLSIQMMDQRAICHSPLVYRSTSGGPDNTLIKTENVTCK